MNDFNFNELVGLLTRVTTYRKLQWTPTSEGPFDAKIGKCTIEMSTDYDSSVGINEYTLSLYNAKGEKFNSYTYNESSQEYVILDQLYTSIRDSIYHISESEQDIMDSLGKLNSQIPEDDLPF